MFLNKLLLAIPVLCLLNVYGEFRMQNVWMILGVVVLFLSLLLSGVSFCFYWNLRKKNRDLSLRIGLQNPVVEEEVNEYVKEETTNEYSRHRELFIRLEEFLLKDRNFAKITDTDMLISELSTNRSYLFEAVKLSTGKTLQEYINTLRMEEAKHLLETTDEVVETISVVCGYSSVRTFYRLFRSHYNVTPAMYRKITQKQNKTKL